MSRLMILLPLLALAGCASAPVAAPPELIHVTKVEYRPLPAADLVPCVAGFTGPLETGADVVAAWQSASAALAVCNGQIANLKQLSNETHP